MHQGKGYIKNKGTKLFKNFSPGQDRTVDLPVDVSKA